MDTYMRRRAASLRVEIAAETDLTRREALKRELALAEASLRIYSRAKQSQAAQKQHATPSPRSSENEPAEANLSQPKRPRPMA